MSVCSGIPRFTLQDAVLNALYSCRCAERTWYFAVLTCDS